MRVVPPPQPNEELYFELLRILDYCYAPTKASKRSYNEAAVARALGVTRKTLDRLRDRYDGWHGWTSVMRDAIIHVMPILPKFKVRHIRKWMRELPEEIIEQIELECEATDYLRDKLAGRPRGVEVWEIMSTAERGNISEIRIRRAAKKMGVKHKREGKGRFHLGYWVLPRHDEVED